MGSVKNNNMDEQVKTKFENFAPPVPMDLWSKIESQLDTPIKAIPIKRRRLSFSIYGGAVAAMLLIAFAFWKFGEHETIDLRRSAEVYISKSPFEGNEPRKEAKNEEENAQQERLFDATPIAAVKKLKAAKNVTSKPQKMEVKLATDANLESSRKEVDYNAVYYESAFSLSVSETPLAMQETLPRESETIALQKNTPLQEDIQYSLVNEINNSKNRRIGVSTVLNFLAKGLSNENGNSIEFSESEEGILKLGLKLGFGKSND